MARGCGVPQRHATHPEMPACEPEESPLTCRPARCLKVNRNFPGSARNLLRAVRLWSPALASTPLQDTLLAECDQPEPPAGSAPARQASAHKPRRPPRAPLPSKWGRIRSGTAWSTEAAACVSAWAAVSRLPTRPGDSTRRGGPARPPLCRRRNARSAGTPRPGLRRGCVLQAPEGRCLGERPALFHPVPLTAPPRVLPRGGGKKSGSPPPQYVA